MRQVITRSIRKTIINSVKALMVDGKLMTKPMEPITVLGHLSDKNVQKLVTKKYGAGAIVVSTEFNESLYSMPVEKFIENADLIGGNN